MTSTSRVNNRCTEVLPSKVKGANLAGFPFLCAFVIQMNLTTTNAYKKYFESRTLERNKKNIASVKTSIFFFIFPGSNFAFSCCFYGANTELK